MGVNKVVVGDEVKLDLTSDTVTAATLPKGITAHDATGTPITGAAEFAPAKHAAQHASGGDDPVTPEAIGAAEKIHKHTTIEQLPITVGTADLTAGTSALATNTIYIMYE